MTRFVITGKARSATRTMFDTLKAHPEIYMKTGIFDARQGSRFIRRAMKHGAMAWLDKRFWKADRPCMGIKCLRLGEMNLWPLLKEPDVKTILLLRNPISCMVSHKQATQDHNWHRKPKARQRKARPVKIVPVQAVKEIRNYEQMVQRVYEVADVLPVAYPQICDDFQEVLRNVCCFLGVAHHEQPPAMKKLRPGSMQARISNFDLLRENLPEDLQHYLRPEELI
jgi:hypothetical protein